MVTSRSPQVAVLASLILAAAGAVAAPEQPGSSGGYYVYADVVEVSPHYGWREVREPVRQCVDVVERSYQYHRGDGYYRRYDERGYGRDHRRHRGDGEAAAGLVGGLIGGLIGNRFGDGNGRTAMTVVGALVGSSIARDRARDMARERHLDSASYDRPVTRCKETERTRRVRDVQGYDVTYRYQGATFHKWLDEHPGEFVRVRVSVEPLQ